jgi:DNA-binding protein HU-beta
MNKQQLIENMAEKSNLTKVDAKKALDAFIQTTTSELASGGSIQLTGFGSFIVRERAARSGRNPKTGESIQIKATKVPVFKSGKSLKNAIKDN